MSAAAMPWMRLVGLTTSTTLQGRLSFTAHIPGDAPPNGLLDVTGTVLGGQVLRLDLTGTATDDLGVQSVRVALRDLDTNRYLQPNGTMSAAYADLPAVLATPGGTSTTWSLSRDLPTEGDWSVTAYAFDTAGQQDTSTTGATARYEIYPGDLPPTFVENLRVPTGGETYTEGRIPVTGRVEDEEGEAAIRQAGELGLDAVGREQRTAALHQVEPVRSAHFPGGLLWSAVRLELDDQVGTAKRRALADAIHKDITCCCRIPVIA